MYKRPLALFYLSEPPREEAPLHDFRRLPRGSDRTESPALRFEIRQALFRRVAALELFRESGSEPRRFDATAKLTESPEPVAARMRQILSLPLNQQRAFTDPYDAYNRWRASFEKAGVMVFQASISELDEMRRFSISETPLPVIVVNTKDSVSGRIFSMFHEMALLS